MTTTTMARATTTATDLVALRISDRLREREDRLTEAVTQAFITAGQELAAIREERDYKAAGYAEAMRVLKKLQGRGTASALPTGRRTYGRSRGYGFTRMRGGTAGSTRRGRGSKRTLVTSGWKGRTATRWSRS